jgi:hypothetical protein
MTMAFGQYYYFTSHRDHSAHREASFFKSAVACLSAAILAMDGGLWRVDKLWD